MSVETLSPQAAPRRVGPPALLGIRSRFLVRATEIARQDERFHSLALWGALARGDADEWSGIELVATVSDDAIPDVLDELCLEENFYGRSLIALRAPKKGVEGGAAVSVTYQLAGLLLHVDWYLCPVSLGLYFNDTKPLFVHGKWPRSTTSFAKLRKERPNRDSYKPPRWEQVISMIPVQVAEVARGRPEAVVEARKPMQDRISAYSALSRRIGSLPAKYRDLLPPLFGYLGAARLLGR